MCVCVCVCVCFFPLHFHRTDIWDLVRVVWTLWLRFESADANYYRVSPSTAWVPISGVHGDLGCWLVRILCIAGDKGEYSDPPDSRGLPRPVWMCII